MTKTTTVASAIANRYGIDREPGPPETTRCAHTNAEAHAREVRAANRTVRPDHPRLQSFFRPTSGGRAVRPQPRRGSLPFPPAGLSAAELESGSTAAAAGGGEALARQPPPG